MRQIEVSSLREHVAPQSNQTARHLCFDLPMRAARARLSVAGAADAFSWRPPEDPGFGWARTGSANPGYLEIMSLVAGRQRGSDLECDSGPATTLLGLIVRSEGRGVWARVHRPERHEFGFEVYTRPLGATKGGVRAPSLRSAPTSTPVHWPSSTTYNGKVRRRLTSVGRAMGAGCRCGTLPEWAEVRFD